MDYSDEEIAQMVKDAIATKAPGMRFMIPGQYTPLTTESHMAIGFRIPCEYMGETELCNTGIKNFINALADKACELYDIGIHVINKLEIKISVYKREKRIITRFYYDQSKQQSITLYCDHSKQQTEMISSESVTHDLSELDLNSV